MNHLNILPKRPNVISNDLKCAGGWGSATDPAGELTTLPKTPNHERLRAEGAHTSASAAPQSWPP